MLDSLGSPRDSIGKGHGGLRLRVISHAVALLGNEGTEDGGIQALWEAVVHGLVEELVNDDKVIPYGLFLEGAKVILEHRRELVEEGNDEGGIGILACYSAQIQVIVLDINI